uniref:Uncharacterized protein MANES_03G057400 n=1 Tax=Rhizophora mucronata TaxID=61149 RepID=A0A2P2N4L1_RHIMU
MQERERSKSSHSLAANFIRIEEMGQDSLNRSMRTSRFEPTMIYNHREKEIRRREK